MISTHTYQVLVGNVDTVYDGTDERKAKLTYAEYVEQSRDGYGRAAFERVILLTDDEIEEEYWPDETERIVSLRMPPGRPDIPHDCQLTEWECSSYRGGVWHQESPHEAAYTSYGDYRNLSDPDDANGHEFVYLLPGPLGGSDYSGGFLCKANYKDFLEEVTTEEVRSALSIHDVSGGYSTYAIAIPLWVWETECCNLCGDDDPCTLCRASHEIRECIEALEDYPLINDETLSNLEMEDWSEQWEDYARSDFLGELSSLYPDQYEFDEVSDESADELFYKLCEDTGTYPEVDGESMYIRMSDLTIECARQDIEALEGITRYPPDDDDEKAEWEAEKSEERGVYFEGYRYCVIAYVKFSNYTRVDTKAFPRKTYHANKQGARVLLQRVNCETGWSGFGYRIDYTPEPNATALLPGFEANETPRTETERQ